ncbi:MAG TPA: ShlB/FhaC/HecB family hemolysin secretion/activation protein [Steroidobacteraceae bacterium]|jgi:hemolysin activation/secretion protein
MHASSPRRWALGLCLLLAASVHTTRAAADSIGDFAITRVDVQGNTLLDPSLVQGLVGEFVGQNRDFSYVERALAALQAAYRERGFSLVKVVLPEQELNEGVVHISVIETRIGEVRVAGNDFHDAANVRHSLPTIVEGAIPNTDALSANLRMANENPSRKVNLQLQSGAAPGVVDAVVQVEDSKDWSAGALVDNSGNDSSGHTHVTAQYQNFNIGGLDHVFTASYTTSVEEPSRMSVYGAGYHIPLYSLRDSLDFYGTYSNVDAGVVSAGLLNLAVSGAGTVFGTHFNHDLRRIGNYESQLTLGFDHKAFRNDVTFMGTQLGGDITVNPLSLSYAAQWALAAGRLNFYLTGVRNIPGGSQASDANFTASRSGATSDYALLRYGVGFARQLPRDWQMRLTLNGQATNDALVAGEQFGVGGATSVRGLEEREISNDQGFSANAELYTPNLCGQLLGGTTRCNVLGFFDGARVSRNDALAGEIDHERVSTVGAGFRLSSGKSLSLQVDYGHVVSASEPEVRGDERFHALLVFTY